LSLTDLPDFILKNYEVYEWRHASAVLYNDFPDEWDDIVEVLTNFRLKQSAIVVGGGNKSEGATDIDNHFNRLGWRETKFDTSISITEYEVVGRSRRNFIEKDSFEIQSPTHLVDEYKNRIAVEVEWNNKDPFYDRDLNNFRLLFDLRVISVGVIITRTDELQLLFNRLGIGGKYGMNTTHMGKLIPRLEGGGGGGCPVLAFGISPNLYVEDV
jgi:hypothetical protein